MTHKDVYGDGTMMVMSMATTMMVKSMVLSMMMMVMPMAMATVMAMAMATVMLIMMVTTILFIMVVAKQRASVSNASPNGEPQGMTPHHDHKKSILIILIF